MFEGFNLKINSSFKAYLIKNYYNVGENICKVKRRNIARSLDKYLGKEGSLDCSAIQNDWFPTIDSNIFISHSHNDEKLAVSLAGWLYNKFGLVSFIDSYVWGYCDNLLKNLDDEYCVNSEGNFYDYNKRNYSTSHVHIMLATALEKMMNKTECIMFLNTDESILKSKDIFFTRTKSPWIYAEIITTKLIQKILPKRLKMFNVNKSLNESIKLECVEKMLKPTYDINLDHLVSLSVEQLKSLEFYKQSYENSPTRALDKLYEITGVMDLIGKNMINSNNRKGDFINESSNRFVKGSNS